MIADLIGTVVNILLNYGLIFGKFGLPAMAIQELSSGQFVPVA